jgi:hypothetical protein
MAARYELIVGQQFPDSEEDIAFSRLVNLKLNEGYQLYGNTGGVFDSTSHRIFYFQAMIKEE